jgi:hypothetical protein
LLLPNLHHESIETVAVFSDYGGDQGRYRTYSFAVVDWNALHGCVQHFKTIREKHGLNAPYKEIAFKSMGVRPTRPRPRRLPVRGRARSRFALQLDR